jgi:hypothetical protein
VKTSCRRHWWAWPVAVVLLASSLVGCSLTSTSVAIDWVDFVQFNGITYLRNIESDAPLQETDLGAPYATVHFKMSGNIDDPSYRSKDGDAAFLEPGTIMYEIHGYSPTVRLATHVDGQIALYEAKIEQGDASVTDRCKAFSARRLSTPRSNER